MKNYEKNQYPGNINKWEETNPKTLSIHAMHESQAAELNSQFPNTGIKYEETDKEPHEFKKTTIDESDHGEQDLTVKDGKLKVTKNKPRDKAKEVKKEEKQEEKKADIPPAA